jgi:integrase
MASVRRRTRSAANGRETTSWLADYFDQHGQRHRKAFSTKKAAAAWLVEAQGEIARGVHTPERQSITVHEAALLWLRRGEVEGLERGTLVSYERVARLHIGPSKIGNVKLALLATPLIEEWRDQLVATHSRHLARRVLDTLKAILNEAQRRGLVGQNAALPVRIDTKKRDQQKLEIGHGIPGKREIQQILAALSEARWVRYRPLFVTAIFTGMRASELRGLSWSAVDFARKTITVRQRADEWGTLGSPKSHAGQRTIPMSPTVLNTLRKWKAACPEGESDLVFPNTRGKVEPLTNLTYRIWRPLQRAIGLVDETGEPLFNFHALRHFAASLWIELGFSPKRLQALLGHSSVQMTFDRYGHLFPSTEDDHERFARGEVGLVA